MPLGLIGHEDYMKFYSKRKAGEQAFLDDGLKNWVIQKKFS
jgi:hypothetical protein